MKKKLIFSEPKLLSPKELPNVYKAALYLFVRGGFKTQTAVARPEPPVLAGCYCSEQCQPPGNGWVLKPPLSNFTLHQTFKMFTDEKLTWYLNSYQLRMDWVNYYQKSRHIMWILKIDRPCQTTTFFKNINACLIAVRGFLCFGFGSTIISNCICLEFLCDQYLYRLAPQGIWEKSHISAFNVNPVFVLVKQARCRVSLHNPSRYERNSYCDVLRFYYFFLSWQAPRRLHCVHSDLYQSKFIWYILTWVNWILNTFIC